MLATGSQEHDGGGREKAGPFNQYTVARVLKVGWVNLVPDAIAAALGCGEARRPRPEERVEHGIPDEGEHPDQPPREFQVVGAGWCLVEASVKPCHICWNHSL
jgi:hypothetical protein